MHMKERRRKQYKKKPRKPEPGLMVWVDGSNLEFALRRFKKKVEQAGIMREVYDRQYYVKPSEIKRKKKRLSKYKQSNQSKRGK